MVTNTSSPLKIVAIAAAVLAVAAGMGVVVALTLGANEGPPEGQRPSRPDNITPSRAVNRVDVAEKAASDGSSDAAYLDEVADIQNGSGELPPEQRQAAALRWTHR